MKERDAKQKTDRKHDWEPVDSQGYTMECLKCGEHIYMDSPFWNELIDADCPGEIGQQEEK